MTIGSYSKDDRKIVSVLSGGTPVDVQIGLVHAKAWNGGDFGQLSGATFVSKRPFSMAQEPVDPINLSLVKGVKSVGRTGRTPKRAMNREDHPYTMTSSMINHSLITTTSPGYPAQPSTNRVFSSVSAGAKGNFDPPVFGANQQAQLINQLNRKIAGSDFNLGVFLGTGKQSLDMVASSATRIYRALKHLKRGEFAAVGSALGKASANVRYDKFRKAGYLDYDDFLKREKRLDVRRKKLTEFDRDLSSAWLEYSYGWKPLLSDVHGAMQHVAERLERNPERTVRASISMVKKYPRGGLPSQSAYVVLLNGVSRRSRSVIARIACENQMELSGLTDVTSVAWELTPWSFVVDWFLPIGDYLNASNFNKKVSASYIVTDFREDSWSGFDYVQPGVSVISGPNEAFEKIHSVNRVLSSSLSVGLPEFKPLKEVFSWNRAANAVALLDQIRPRP